MGSISRPPNGFLSTLPADDFELIGPHLRTVDLAPESALVEADETLKRAYLPHSSVISLEACEGRARSGRNDLPRQHLRLVLRSWRPDRVE
jgi:hypothetical protein